MSQSNQRGRFSGHGHGGDRETGRNGNRDGGRYGGRYQSSQTNRVYAKPPDDEENFMFDIYQNRVETVKFVAAQRKLCDYESTRYPDVSKIFSHGVVTTYARPPKPAVEGGADPQHYKRD